MASSDGVAAAPVLEPQTHRFSCAEVWGGNRAIHERVDLPGLHGVVYSRPCKGGRGGDVHYMSVCGYGLMSRVCLADVAGHGEAVAGVSAEMHDLLRRLMNTPDQRRVLSRLNRRLEQMGLGAMTTAVALTRYPPQELLSISYAGHPPGWLYEAARDAWRRLTLDRKTEAAAELVDSAMAVDRAVRYTRTRIRVVAGDRVLLVTDGVLEAPGREGGQFGAERVEAVLAAQRHAPVDELATALIDALVRYVGTAEFTHDDVTFFVADIVGGPPGPALWQALKNRVLRPLGLARASDAESS